MPAALPAARQAIATARGAFDRGDQSAAAAALGRVEQLLTGRQDDEAAAVRHTARALAAYHAGDADSCLAAQERLLIALRRTGALAALGDALIRDAGARMSFGRPGSAERLDEGLEIARNIGDLVLEARASGTRAMLALREGRPADALIGAAECAVAARLSRDTRWLAAAEGTSAGALLALGDPPGARRLALSALETVRAAGLDRVALDLELGAVHALLASDRAGEAAERLERLEEAIPPEDVRLSAKLEVARGVLARATGEPEAALSALERAAIGWTRLEDKSQIAETLCAAVAVAVEAGLVDRAVVLRAGLARTPPPPALEALAEARLAHLLDAPGAATEAARRAVSVARERGSPALLDEALEHQLALTRAGGRVDAALAAAVELAQTRAAATQAVLEARGAADAAAARVLSRAEEIDRGTGLGTAARAARQTRQDLVEAMQQLAHRVRNALANVGACGELMVLSDDRARRGVLQDRIQAGVERACEELDLAVQLARGGEVGEAPVTKLAPLAYRVVELYRANAERKDIALAARIHTPACARIDPVQARDLLENLVSNSVKFCRTGDTVQVRIAAEGAWATVTVCDDGPGIPAVDHARVFEPRAVSTSRPTGGEPSTGLGLSMVRTAAERAGGDVTLASAPGAGATFQVRLPLA